AAERTTHAFLFAGIIARVYIDNFLLKQALYRLLDLNFVCPKTDAENVLIFFFTHQRRLLRQGRGLNDVVGLVHFRKITLQPWRRRTSFPPTAGAICASLRFSRTRAIAPCSRQ